jgi:thioredoxin 1
MSTLNHYKEADFDQSVLSNSKPVLVDFYADWCGPCRMMAPILDEIAVEFESRVEVGKLDVDDSPGIAMRYSVMGIPTLGFFRAGQLVDRLVGYPGPANTRAWLEKALGAPTTA